MTHHGGGGGGTPAGSELDPSKGAGPGPGLQPFTGCPAGTVWSIVQQNCVPADAHGCGPGESWIANGPRGPGCYAQECPPGAAPGTAGCPGPTEGEPYNPGGGPDCGPGMHWNANAKECRPGPGGGGGGGTGGGGGGGRPVAAAGTSAEDELTKAVSELARMLAGQASGLYNVGYPAYAQAVNYYSALLGRGGRAAASAATAPAAEGIAQNYAGAERSLLSGYLRGGARDAALAELNRSKAADIAHLTAGVQPAAAQALISSGLAGATAGMGGTGESAQLYGGLLSGQQQDRQFQATLAENQRQFDKSLALQEKALAQAGGGGGGGGNPGLAEAALAEQRRQFDASLAFQQQQASSQRKLAIGSTVGTLLGGIIGGAATKNPAGVGVGAGVGGQIGGSIGGGSGRGSSGKSGSPSNRGNFPLVSPSQGGDF